MVYILYIATIITGGSVTVSKADRVENGRTDLPLKPNGRRWPLSCLYYPEYCDTLLEMMRQGASEHQVAAKLEVSVRTMENWAKDFPDWKEALEAGRDWARGWWHGMAQSHLSITEEKGGPRTKFDTRSYTFTMSTRYGEREKDSQVVLHVDKDVDSKKVIDLVNKMHNEDL